MTETVNQKPFRLFRFLLQSLDPVHVGVGGYRLGRVDLPIAREPGTNLPKLPGTGISGAARHYAALRYGKPVCAGQGRDEGLEGDKARGHCGKPGCPICYTFGSLSVRDGEEKGAAAGTVRIFDARLLLFPVHTMAGPVWVTSPETLRDFGLNVNLNPGKDQVYVAGELRQLKVLNLGWLMLEVAGQNNQGDSFNLSLPPESAQVEGQAKNLVDRLPETVKNRTVLVADEYFDQVVNSNLEVRTSVSIDPETGAVKQGALFTYEAIPRATFFWLDVVENDYRKSGSASPEKKRGPFPVERQACPDEKGTGWKENAGAPLGTTWNSPVDVVASGIAWFEYLGVGGMGTRGFGRIKKLACAGGDAVC